MDITPEKYERIQDAAFIKAINSYEGPVKEKHIRTLILGTHRERGAGTFWRNAQKLSLFENQHIAWKFCYVLHKLLHEGDSHVLVDSLKYRSKINSVAKMWGHLSEGYGPLIEQYCSLLDMKLEFHRRNPSMPGNLQLSDEEFDRIGQPDPNEWFQLSVEILDYMDELLKLFAAVFHSLDRTKSSSMTFAGQGRLAPLILCIVESSSLYDYLVKGLFKLHDCLPLDLLSGHRSRFIEQFKLLKRFYETSGTLQYFKFLVSVPSLPQNPPNFLLANDLSEYVSPKVIFHDHKSENTGESPADNQSLPDTLIEMNDFSDQLKTPPSGHEEERMKELEEKEQIIAQLCVDLNQARAAYQQMQQEYSAVTEKLQIRVSELEDVLSVTKSTVDAVSQENESCRNMCEKLQNEKNEKNQEMEQKISELTETADSYKAKYNQMKQVYSKFRSEHVEKLKAFCALQKEVSEKDAGNVELQSEKEKVEGRLGELQAQLEARDSAYADLETLHTQLKQENDELKQQHSQLNDEFQKLTAAKDAGTEALAVSEAKLESVSVDLSEIKALLEKSESESARLREELSYMTSKHEDLTDSFQEVQRRLKDLQQEHERLAADHQVLAASESAAVTALTACKVEVELVSGKLAETATQLEESQQLLADLQQKHDSLDADHESLKASQTAGAAALAACEARVAAISLELTDTKTRLQDSTNKLISLQTSHAEAKHQLETTLLDAEQLKAQCCQLNKQNELIVQENSENVTQLHAAIQNLTCDLSEVTKAKESCATERDFLQHIIQSLPQSMSRMCQRILDETVAKFENPASLTISCSPEFLLTFKQMVTSSLSEVQQLFANDGHSLPERVAALLPFMQHLCTCLSVAAFCGRATANVAPTSRNQEFVNACLTFVTDSKAFFAEIGTLKVSEKLFEQTLTFVANFFDLFQSLLTVMADVNSDELAELYEKEVRVLNSAIQDAAAKIEAILAKERETGSGVRLEVNEKILDSCTQLIQAVLRLVRDANVLQKEIVAQGRGTASEKEFYKRHHQWTEGLFSAAKAVGLRASVLVEAADRVVNQKGKFEELVVASQEVAASTAQLVIASIVKAEKDSKQLQKLENSSHNVTSATATVVAMVKTGQQTLDDVIPDFSALSLHASKRMEMETQIKVLELESQVEKERKKLSELRKRHYLLGGEDEGWEAAAEPGAKPK